MDAVALGGLCGCGRDQVLATDDRVPQGGSQQSDWQRAVQAVPGTDLGEGVLTPQGAAICSTTLKDQTDWADRSQGRFRIAGGTSAIPPAEP